MIDDRLVKIGLPEDVVLHEPYMYLKGNHSIVIQNHRGIINMDDKCVELRLQMGNIQINGSCLMVVSYSIDELEISGRIKELLFCYERVV